jgi:hypothetical protein
MHLANRFALAALAVFAYAQPASQFTGTWEGQMNGQPGVQITLASESGKLGGTIVFYFQRLGSDGKWQVEGENRPQPLINPQMNGKILNFEVLHHKKHGGSELGPNKKFRLEVTGAKEARLREAGTPDDIPGHGLKMTRKMNP